MHILYVEHENSLKSLHSYKYWFLHWRCLSLLLKELLSLFPVSCCWWEQLSMMELNLVRSDLCIFVSMWLKHMDNENKSEVLCRLICECVQDGVAQQVHMLWSLLQKRFFSPDLTYLKKKEKLNLWSVETLLNSWGKLTGVLHLISSKMLLSGCHWL